METLIGTDKFRQLLKKFSQSKPSAEVRLNHDTRVRKSNREIKKPVQHDANPYVATAKDPKRKDKSVEHKNKSAERRDKSGERGDRSGGRKDKSRERMTGTDDEAPAVSGTIHQDLRKESVSCGSSSPRRSAFTRVLANENKCSLTTARQAFHEPVSQSQPSVRRVDSGRCEELTRRQDHEDSYMPDRRRERDFESSYMPERRQQEYGTSYEPEKRLADMYCERSRDVLTKPRPVSSNQSRCHPNASRNVDIYGTIRQTVVRLDDTAIAREHSVLNRSRIDMPPPDIQQPRLFGIMKSQEKAAWQHSRMAQPLPDHSERYDGGFLRPLPPTGTAELARKEESTFLDALSKFTNYSLFSTVEVIFLLNHLRDSLIHKMSKTIRKSDTAQSMLRMTMMETVPEDASRRHMVRSWLKSNDSVAPSRLADDTEVHSKRMREPTEYEYAKRMRVVAEEDGESYQRPR